MVPLVLTVLTVPPIIIPIKDCECKGEHPLIGMTVPPIIIPMKDCECTGEHPNPESLSHLTDLE